MVVAPPSIELRSYKLDHACRCIFSIVQLALNVMHGILEAWQRIEEGDVKNGERTESKFSEDFCYPPVP